ncbi:MAG: hypothetical protein QOI15_2936 [Pseudonocardiales bacterium]|nr:hypothetical protein [Pseudonocardiales bacterium]
MTELPAATVTHVDVECVIALHGDVDIASAAEVGAVAKEAISTCPDDSRRIVIDLAAVSFLDSSGIGALVDIRNFGLGRGIPTMLTNLPGAVSRVLEIGGLGGVFESAAD